MDGVVKLSLNLEHSSRTRGPSPISPYNAINADSNAYRKKDVYVSHCQPFITRFKSITRKIAGQAYEVCPWKPDQ